MSDDDRNLRLTLSVVSFSYPRGLTEDDDDDYWGGDSCSTVGHCRIRTNLDLGGERKLSLD